MWTINKADIKTSRKTTQELEQANQPLGNASNIALEFTIKNGSKAISYSTFVESEEVAVNTMRNHVEKLNAQEEFIAKVEAGFDLPPKPTEPEKTDLQKKEDLYRAELAELEELINLQEKGIITNQNEITNKKNVVRNARTEYENARRNA